ncbi:MAG: hypothetical protein NC489_44010 [Ruminococcus flavefaciens]|nr:hypothetical protein [Ruminococcus flavefaciens]
MEEWKCRFNSCGKYCRILAVESCDGNNTDCSFFRTEQQFREAADRAVLINRRNHRCENCTYVTKKCRTYSAENKKGKSRMTKGIIEAFEAKFRTHFRNINEIKREFSTAEILDVWLEYVGIVGYTCNIVELLGECDIFIEE